MVLRWTPTQADLADAHAARGRAAPDVAGLRALLTTAVRPR
jgi:hypothetical protein